MKLKLFIMVALMVFGNQASAQKLGSGLTWQQFQQRFASSADWDKETAVRLTSCQLKTIPNKSLQSFGCQISSAGMIDGITAVKGPMRDVSVAFLAQDTSAIHEFQRASKYLIYATQGDRTFGALTVITELMGAALKTPSKTQSKVVEGIRYTAMFERVGVSGPMWHFWAERS